MKRAITLFLALIMVFALVACGESGPTITEEQMYDYEAYADAAVDVGTYRSSEKIEDVIIYTGDDIVGYIESLGGELELLNISNAGAVVVIYVSTTTYTGHRIFLLNKRVADSTITDIDNKQTDLSDMSGYERTLLSLQNSINSATLGSNAVVLYDGSTAFAADSNQDPADDVAYLMRELGITDETNEDAVRWKIAQLELRLEDYETKNAEKIAPFADRLAAIRGTENYGESIEWFALQNESTYIKKIAIYEYQIAQTRRHLAVYESFTAPETAVTDENEVYARFIEAYEYDLMLAERHELLDSIGYYTLKMRADEQAANEQYALVATEMEALQKEFGETYKFTLEYQLLLARGSKLGEFGAYRRYADAIRSIELKEQILAYFDAYHATDDVREKKMYEYLLKEYEEYYEENTKIARQYAQKIAAYDAYLEKNKEAIDAFNAEFESIKSRYEENDNGWEKDNDYLKLVLKNEYMLNTVANYEDDLAKLKTEFDALEAQYKSDVEYIKAICEAEKKIDIITADRMKIASALSKIRNDFKPAEAEEEGRRPKDPPAFVFYEGHDGWVIAEPEFIDELNDKRAIYTPPSGGGGGGSGGRTCAKAGCTKKAVTSGDSIYCSTHSRRCGSCGCYIDADAMYCMDCIRKALS